MLSEGRIEADGTLACAYHGWRFNGEGQCTTLPQTFGQEELQRATSNTKSCATSYPVQVQRCYPSVFVTASLPLWHNDLIRAC